MKNILFAIAICFSSVLFFSCGDDEDTIDYEWKNANEEAFNEKALNPEFKKAEIPGGPGAVYYKVLKEGNTTNPDSLPNFTSVVRVLYKGKLINGAVFDDRMTRPQPFTFRIDGKSFYIFDNVQTGTSVIDGWKVALQNMQEGSKWEVWIPWRLGYGASGSGSIPGYSTLVFEIELEKIWEL